MINEQEGREARQRRGIHVIKEIVSALEVVGDDQESI